MPVFYNVTAGFAGLTTRMSVMPVQYCLKKMFENPNVFSPPRRPIKVKIIATVSVAQYLESD
jgi:hypothetical protein